MVCRKCLAERPETDFLGRRFCRHCRTEQVRQWRQQHSARSKASGAAWRKRNSEKLKKYGKARYAANRQRHLALVNSNLERKRNQFLRLKSTLACKKCGESHPACIEFHHRDAAKKEFNISQAWRIGYSWERILAEIVKCDVLCANCHRKEHSELGRSGLKIVRDFKNPASYRKPSI